MRSLLSEEQGRLRVVAQPEVALRGLLRWMTLLLGSPDGDTVRAACLGLGFLLFEGGFSRLLLLPKEALEALVAKLSLVLVSSTQRDEQTALVAASVATGLLIVHDGRARQLALPEDLGAAIVAGLTPLLGSGESSTVEDAVSTLLSLLAVQWPRQRIVSLPPPQLGALVQGLAPLVPISRTALQASLLLLSSEEGYAKVLYSVPPDTAASLVRALAAASPATGRRECSEAAARGFLFLLFNKGFVGMPAEGGNGQLLVTALLSLPPLPQAGAPTDGILARLVVAAPPATVRAALALLSDELRAGAADAAAASQAFYALLQRRPDFWRASARLLQAQLPLYDRRAMLAQMSRAYAAAEGEMGAQPLRLVASPGRPLAAQACEAVLQAHPASLMAGLLVEGWSPEGGARLEAVQQMAEEIAGESSGLFKALPALRCMHPRSSSTPEHVPLFRLLGRLLGLSLAQGVCLPVRLSPLFYKLLFPAETDAETLGLEDLLYTDAALHAQLSELLQQPLPAQPQLVFADELIEAGETVLLPLLPGGLQTPVTEANKALYTALRASARVRRATDAATRAALRQGVVDFLPAELLDPALLSAAELQELIEGSVN
jgi:hypothetical protein